MHIRRADKDDINTLMELRKLQLIDEGQSPNRDIDKGLSDYFVKGLNAGYIRFWVAEDGFEIIATGGIQIFTFPPSFKNETGKTAYLHSVFTKRSHRGRGIAKKIINIALDEARRENCALITLNASIHGRPLYEALGFETVGTHMMMRF